jgi:hypothetical protein
VRQVAVLLKPETMTRPQEDANAGASVDVVGGGEFAGYQAWKTNQDVTGESTWGNVDSSDVATKSKL